MQLLSPRFAANMSFQQEHAECLSAKDVDEGAGGSVLHPHPYCWLRDTLHALAARYMLTA